MHGERHGRPPGAAGEAGNSDTLENLARVGLIAYGVVHLLVAWLAIQLAWFGGGGKSADQSGAMSTLAESPVGKPLLWLIAIGLIALAAWQAAEVLRWRSGWSASGKPRTKAIRKSVKSVIKAVVYIALAVLAIKFATGGGQSSSAAAAGHHGRRLRLAGRPVPRRRRRAGPHRRRASGTCARA